MATQHDIPARTRAIDATLVVIALLVIWDVLARIVGQYALSGPWPTLVETARLLATASFLQQMASTAWALVLSFCISALLGVPLGLLLGIRRFANEVFEPLLTTLYTIPQVTLYPIVLAIFGLGMSAKVAFGVSHAIIPIVLITMGAVRAIRPVHLKTVRVLRLTPLQAMQTIVLPLALPEVMTSLRIGFSLALLGVLVGEIFSSQYGLGFLLINGITTANVVMSISVSLIVMVFSVVAGGVLLALDRKLHRRAHAITGTQES